MVGFGAGQLFFELRNFLSAATDDNTGAGSVDCENNTFRCAFDNHA